MKTIDKAELRKVLNDDISSEELNSKYDTSSVTDVTDMLYGGTPLTHTPEQIEQIVHISNVRRIEF